MFSRRYFAVPVYSPRLALLSYPLPRVKIRSVQRAQSTDLTSKVIVITGAGRGIGLGLAHHLSSLGASLVLNDAGVALKGEPEDEGLIDHVAAEIREFGRPVLASSGSIADPTTAHSLVSMALSEFGSLDAWFNAAVIARDRMIFNMTDEDWPAVSATNPTGAFYCMRAALQHMRQQRSGRVINLVSTAGLIGNIGQSIYAASKGGIVPLSRVAAMEMALYNVAVNCVAPFAYANDRQH